MQMESISKTISNNALEIYSAASKYACISCLPKYLSQSSVSSTSFIVAATDEKAGRLEPVLSKRCHNREQSNLNK